MGEHDRRVKMLEIVTINAFTEAGGVVEQDLFSSAVRIDNPQILEDLYSEHIGAKVEAYASSQGFKNWQFSGRDDPKGSVEVHAPYVGLTEEEAANMLNEEEIKQIALQNVEQNGIVFIDEIDKVARRSDYSGADVSREGVQRDLLPLVEGSSVSTKHGVVKTDHILFVASGAFHLSKPSDLIPELQGRLPLRVELHSLTVSDFERILTEPKASLTEQYTALLDTEGLQLDFTNDAVRRLAEIAWHVNETTENIGARRLHTVMERLLDEISFDAPDRDGQTLQIDASYVDDHLDGVAKNEDLSRYIL